jgi:hypothetical protein
MGYRSNAPLVCVIIFLIWSSADSARIEERGQIGNNTGKNSFCSSPEYRQFDFWLGDWDAIEVGSTTPEARVKVTSVLEGCAVREEYDATDGHKGESLSIYDKSRNAWHQSWFTNRGQFLAIEGRFTAGAMVLTGSDQTTNGKRRLVRGMWKPEGNNVRETAWRSTDNGKTWEPWFDLEFHPHN